jgi:putative transcriptional regulator
LGLGLSRDEGVLARGTGAGAKKIPVNNISRKLRQKKDWSQTELAERLRVSRQTVNAVETGKYDPSFPLPFKIGKIFGLKIEDIFRP